MITAGGVRIVEHDDNSEKSNHVEVRAHSHGPKRGRARLVQT